MDGRRGRASDKREHLSRRSNTVSILIRSCPSCARMGAAYSPMSEEEMAAEDAAPPSPEAEELYDPGSPRSFRIHPMFCNWQNCNRGFWELEDMVQHLHDVHIGPQPAKKPTCEWIDCPRKGKGQISKFALLAHLRSHTGEKPFICPRPGELIGQLAVRRIHTCGPRCPDASCRSGGQSCLGSFWGVARVVDTRPITHVLISSSICRRHLLPGDVLLVYSPTECDKSFTRTDALQKHMRVQHQENLPPTRKPPTKKPKLDIDAGTGEGSDMAGTTASTSAQQSAQPTTPSAHDAGAGAASTSDQKALDDFTASLFDPLLDTETHLLFEELLDSSTFMYDPALLSIGAPLSSGPVTIGNTTPRMTTTPLHYALPPSLLASSSRPVSHDRLPSESQQPASATAPPLPPPVAPPSQANDETGDEDDAELDSPEMAEAIQANPNMAPEQVRYLCMLGRHRAAWQERESLNAELARLQGKRDAIFEEKESMLSAILTAELGSEAEVVVKPVHPDDAPKLVWSLHNRTSLPNIGRREIKEEPRGRGHGDDDDE